MIKNLVLRPCLTSWLLCLYCPGNTYQTQVNSNLVTIYQWLQRFSLVTFLHFVPSGDESRVNSPSSDSPSPSDDSLISSLLHVCHRDPSDCTCHCSLPLHHRPRLPQAEETVEKPQKVKWWQGNCDTLGLGCCLSVSVPLSFYSSVLFFLFKELWRPRRWVLFRQSSCWIDSTPTPCTSEFPCCWTQSCWL